MANDPPTYPSWTPTDMARRQRTLAAMNTGGAPTLPSLPMVTEAEAACRQPQEIARRLIAMFGVCVYCEVRSGGETRDGTAKYLAKIDDILSSQLHDVLTPDEQAFLATEPPESGALANFGWRYECCHVLMWALGLSELGYPSDICDVSAIGSVIWRLDNVASLLAQASPRSPDELLDAADLVLMYDWACVDARINRRSAPAGLNGEVVVEWHRATNWLVGAYDNADWDEVGTDT